MISKLKLIIKKRKKSIKVFLCASLILFIVFSAYITYENFSVETEHFYRTTEELHESFNGYKIAHISDYHNRKSTLIDNAVIDSLNAEKPDVIFFTGDLVDSRKTDIPVSIAFMEKLVKIAPVYYVTGNHECNVSVDNQEAFDKMIADIEAIGVTVLRNEKMKIYNDEGDSFNLYGIDTPFFYCSSMLEITQTTNELCSELDVEDGFNILLAHHPEQMDVYTLYGFDLVFSGHAHGGQVRLFGQGLVAPNQGFFPRYTSGLYANGKTILVVSRGLGNSIAPVRVFNKPHLIITELKVK